MLKKALIALSLFLGSQITQACEITMGYRTNAKPPFINEMPDNSGLYYDLYHEATQRIGCELRVMRQPKGRVMHMIEAGKIDFYPGLSYTEERNTFATFIANGLKDSNIGISRADEAEVTSLENIADRDMVMVVSFGGFDNYAEDYGINVRHPYDFTLSEIIDLILDKKADFHAYNLLAIQYYMMNNPEKAKQLRIHPNCCDVAHNMYLGFSKKSPHLRLIPNPNYTPEQEVSERNPLYIPAPDSIAGKLQAALVAMQDDGSFQKIYRKYFGSTP